MCQSNKDKHSFPLKYLNWGVTSRTESSFTSKLLSLYQERVLLGTGLLGGILGPRKKIYISGPGTKIFTTSRGVKTRESEKVLPCVSSTYQSSSFSLIFSTSWLKNCARTWTWTFWACILHLWPQDHRPLGPHLLQASKAHPSHPNSVPGPEYEPALQESIEYFWNPVFDRQLKKTIFDYMEIFQNEINVSQKLSVKKRVVKLQSKIQ